MISSKNLIEFILKHRHGKVFRNLSEGQVATIVIQAIEARLCIVDCDTDRTIFGVAIGTIYDPKKKIMHVNHILTIQRGSLQRILWHFINLFPGWTIRAERHGKIVHYETPERFTKLARKVFKTYG